MLGNRYAGAVLPVDMEWFLRNVNEEMTCG